MPKPLPNRNVLPVLWMFLSWISVWAGCAPVHEHAVDPPTGDWLAWSPSAEVSAGTAEDWPAFRGGRSGGLATRSTAPIVLDRTTQSWRVELPGEGNSSPVVDGNHVYLTTCLRESENRLVVQCFDRESGRSCWQTPVSVAAGPTHQKAGFAAATVACSGEFVVASFGGQGLFGLTRDGLLVWKADMGPVQHQWGSASSPLIVGDRVFVLCEGDEESSLAAFQLETGQEVWRTPRASRGCWATPVYYERELEDRSLSREIVVNGTGSGNGDSGWIISYSASDGSILWRHQGTSDVPCPTLIVGQGVLVSTSGANGPIVALQPNAQDVSASPTLIWQQAQGGPLVPTGLAHDDHLFVVNDQGILTCLNLFSGKSLAKRRVGRAVTASLIASQNHLYVTDEDGRITVLETRPPFDTLVENELKEACLATPALSGDALFVRTARHLICYRNRQASGSQVAELSAPVDAGPSSADAPGTWEQPANQPRSRGGESPASSSTLAPFPLQESTHAR